MTKTYAITEEQRNVLLSNHLLLKHETDILKSLPLITGEPIAYARPEIVQMVTHQMAVVNATYGDGYTTPLYTHPQPLQPITANEVTEKMANDAQPCVSLQITDDGVWAHFRVGNGFAYSQNLSADNMSKKFADEYIAAVKHKGHTK